MKNKKYIFKSFLMISIIGIGLFNFAKTYASFFSNNDLKLKSKGEDVRKLQNFLIEQGYLTPINANTSGNSEVLSQYFGLTTQAALITFQNNNNISPDGVFGSTTREAAEKVKANAQVNSMMPVLPVGQTNTPATTKSDADLQGNIDENNKIFLKAKNEDIKINKITVDFNNNQVSIIYAGTDTKVVHTIDITPTIPTDSDNFEIVIGKTTIEFDKNDIKENIYLNNDLDIIIKKDEVQEFSIKSLVVATTTDAALGTAGHDSTNSLETKTYTVKQKTPPLNKSEEDFSTVIAAGSAQKITDTTGKAFEDLPIIPTATALATGVFIVAGSIIGDTTITYTPNENFDPTKAYEINTTDGEGIYYRTQNSSGGYDYFATDIHGGNTVQITFSDSALNGVANLTGWVKVQ